MPVPKKITPDSIIDAAIEIKYLSNLPFEVLIGVFFDAFDETYQYTTRPLKTQPSVLPTNPLQDLVLNIGSQSLLYNDSISIKLLPNSIVFGCLDKYIGWERYSAEINKALNTIGATKRIEKWNRVGLRYIHEYPQKDLKEFTHFRFTFGFQDIQSTSTAFRTEFQFQGARFILNLNNKVPTLKQEETKKILQLVPTSIIDVDVIKDNLSLTRIEELLEVIHHTHDIEKAFFFDLLTKEYVDTLKPEY